MTILAAKHLIKQKKIFEPCYQLPGENKILADTAVIMKKNTSAYHVFIMERN